MPLETLKNGKFLSFLLTFSIGLSVSAFYAMPVEAVMYIPVASGISVTKNATTLIDHSNLHDGYVMIMSLEPTDKRLAVIITGPSGAQYTYNLNTKGNYDVFPLSDGNGRYEINVFQQTEAARFSLRASTSIQVALTDEFAPFVRPSQYVNFRENSQVVKKTAELIQDSMSIVDKITIVYNFVISHITYDKVLATTVQSGYLPDVDHVLERGKGICFDYAAVMASMLRSKGIPVKLVIGYAGDVYHSWLDVFSPETGWINAAIFFDGRSWRLMDPTFSSVGNQSAFIMQFIGDGSNYKAVYIY